MTDWTAVSSVFVYGTLMPGERNEAVARQGGPFRCEQASLSGAALFDLRPEAYPALFPALFEDELETGGTVHGWLYTYAPADWGAAWPFLDDLEGLHLSPPLYRRAPVTVQVHPTGEPRLAWVYWYARADRRRSPGCLPVPSGRWESVPDRHQLDEQQQPEDGRRR